MVALSIFKEKCIICKSKNVQIINTYKHYWRVCNACGNAFSKVKEHYSLSFLPFQRLKKAISEDPANTYVFANCSAEQIKQDEDQAIMLSEEWINSFNINLEGKKFIEISGGSGHFLNALRKYNMELFHTELNPKDVEYVNNNLGIKSKKFDFHKDELQNLFQEEFDIILLKGALEFCLDIKTFLNNIKKNTHPNTIIIVITCVPTLGNFLLTQFDDYNQQVLFQKETLTNIFKEQYYSLWESRDIGETRNVYPLAPYRNKLSRMLMLRYMIPAMNKLSTDSRFIFHALSVRGIQLVFKRGK
jgi:2-polyprenyl-3-methyl-5-hydroxy-6-metoxy-1,4-benzoquinol methylase